MTGIQWTDETWNPVTGCTRVSEGCRHCYIERTPPFRMAGRTVGDPIQLHPERLEQPLHWQKPRRVFVNSLSDLFHEDVPDYFIDQMFAVMLCSPGHVFQILTKRPHRMRRYMSDDIGRVGYIWHAAYQVNGITAPRGKMPPPFPYPHVHLGVSVEDQKTADERIPILLQTPAAVRFVSAEPLLGPVDLTRITTKHEEWNALDRVEAADAEPGSCSSFLDWVIVGGESGPQARPCNVSWIRAMVRQCQAATVPVFVKQLGSNCIDRNDAGFEGDTPDSWPMDTRFVQTPFERDYQGTYGQVLLRKKGGNPGEWPEDLRVREFPHAVLAQAVVR